MGTLDTVDERDAKRIHKLGGDRERALQRKKLVASGMTEDEVRPLPVQGKILIEAIPSCN